MREILRQFSSKDLEILNYIQKNGPITKKALQDITGMKLTTLNRTMKLLENKRIISEASISKSTGGRKPIEYDVVSSGIYIIGIDISRTYVKTIISNLKMNILREEQFIMDDTFSPQKTVEKINYLVEKMLADLSIDKNEVLGMGVGTVGPLNRNEGIVINPKGFFNKEWINVPIKVMLENKVDIPCILDNGANAAVLGEYLYGNGKNLRSILYIHCGIGIRSASITDGIINRTINDCEDAFAHMIVEANGEKCSCGNRGCIESYASIEGITKRYISTIVNDQELSIKRELNGENYSELLNSARKSDKTALEIINKGAENFGIGLANLVKILNPQLVILCGPLINNYSPYYSLCIDAFHKNNCLNNKVIFSKGGAYAEDAIVLGTAAMVIEQYLKNKGETVQ